MVKGFIIGAPKSGSGKTVISAGLMRAFSNEGVAIAPAKIGPDYIDPKFHEQACGVPSVNLDGWAMRSAFLRQLINNQSKDKKLMLIEGVMGLFDGSLSPGKVGFGATSDLAKFLNLPVILTVDTSRMGRSVGALISGFLNYDKDINIAGVILNKAGSLRHMDMLEGAMKELGIPLVGILPRTELLTWPSRHLGLMQAQELTALDQQLDEIAAFFKEHLDLDLLQSLAGDIGSAKGGDKGLIQPIAPLGQRMAIAADKAFSFSYPHLINGWREQGAELSFFSPLDDEGPDNKADSIYLPGGYPELYAGQIAGNQNFKNKMQKAIERGAFIYGECGGFMVLGKGLIDKDGQSHKMIGALDLITSFEKRSLHLGYRLLTPAPQCPPFLKAAKQVRGHEYHYSSIIKESGAPLWQREDGTSAGLVKGNVAGSYMHIIDIDEN